MQIRSQLDCRNSDIRNPSHLLVLLVLMQYSGMQILRTAGFSRGSPQLQVFSIYKMDKIMWLSFSSEFPWMTVTIVISSGEQQVAQYINQRIVFLKINYYLPKQSAHNTPLTIHLNPPSAQILPRRCLIVALSQDLSHKFPGMQVEKVGTRLGGTKGGFIK